MFKDDLLKGKRILVTGGGSGLGKEMSRYFLKYGAEVLICGRRVGVLEDTAKELISRATESLEKEKIEISKKLKDLGVEDALHNLKGITQGMLVVLGEKNIKKLKDFAELSSDELIGGYDEIKGKRIKINGYLEDFALSREEADSLIMAAREIVFKN